MNLILRKLVAQQMRSNARNYNIPANYRKPTMDDLPVPQGSWQANYDANQSKYNKQLILGAGFFVFTMIVCKTSGLFFFNWGPPPLPKKE